MGGGGFYTDVGVHETNLAIQQNIDPYQKSFLWYLDKTLQNEVKLFHQIHTGFDYQVKLKIRVVRFRYGQKGQETLVLE